MGIAAAETVFTHERSSVDWDESSVISFSFSMINWN
jgi:hypothetical protein